MRHFIRQVVNVLAKYLRGHIDYHFDVRLEPLDPFAKPFMVSAVVGDGPLTDALRHNNDEQRHMCVFWLDSQRNVAFFAFSIVFQVYQIYRGVAHNKPASSYIGLGRHGISENV